MFHKKHTRFGRIRRFEKCLKKNVKSPREKSPEKSQEKHPLVFTETDVDKLFEGFTKILQNRPRQDYSWKCRDKGLKISDSVVIDNTEDLCKMIDRGVECLDEIPNIRNIAFTENVISISKAFYNMKNLKDISALSTWDVSNVLYFKNVFENCHKLESLKGVENWNMENAMTFSRMFYRCDVLADISALSSWDVSGVLSYENMFFYCESLFDVSPLSHWDVSNGRIFGRMFIGCPIMNIYKLRNWDVSKGMEFKHIFGEDYLTKITEELNWNIRRKSVFTVDPKDYRYESHDYFFDSLIWDIHTARNHSKYNENEELSEYVYKNSLINF